MPSDNEDDLPVSHAIADGWAEFAERVMPGVGGTTHGQAHVAVHFGALYVLQLSQEIVEQGYAHQALGPGVIDADHSAKVAYFTTLFAGTALVGAAVREASHRLMTGRNPESILPPLLDTRSIEGRRPGSLR